LPDSLVWQFSASSVYSTSSGNELAIRLKKPKKPRKELVSIYDENIWHSIWGFPVQPKLQFFVWRLLHRIIPTLESLNERGMNLSLVCPVSHSADESIEHILFECPVTLAFYRMARLIPPTFTNSHFATYWRSIIHNQRDLAPIRVLSW
ncbi:Putative ribonuclease H protein At1g65750, partial [Linum perenne]